MAEMSVEQQRALAMARARMRLSESGAEKPPKALTSDNPGLIDRFILNNFSGSLAKLPDIQGTNSGRFIQGLADLPVGAMQLGANAVGLGELVNPRIADMNARTESLRGDDSGSFDVPRFMGNLANPVPYKAGAALGASSGLGANVLKSAALGGGLGASSPVVGEGDYWTNKAIQTGVGAGFGAALPVVGAGLRASYSGIRNLVDPKLPGGIKRAAGRTMNRAAGDDKNEIMRLLAEGKTIVPGTKPTAGEVAAPATRAEFNALQNISEKFNPTPFGRITAANEAARKNAIGGIAKTVDDLRNAVDFRGGNASVNYGRAEGQVIKPDAELADLLGRMSPDGILQKAQALAARKGEAFAQTNAEGKITGIPVKSLHYIKMALDDVISAKPEAGIGNSIKSASTATKNDFIRWLGNKSPAYDEARKRFAVDSDPINRMEIGRKLYDSLTSSIGQKERATVFGNAVRNEARTIKSATSGGSRFDTLDDAFKSAPKDLAAIRSVVDDLARGDLAAELARSGAPRAKQLIGETAPKLPATGPLHQTYMVVKTILNRVSGKIEGKSLEAMAKAMETPEGALQAMKAAGVEQDVINKLFGGGKVGSKSLNAINSLIMQENK